MKTETKKNNTDYSKKAVNLRNPDEVKIQLNIYLHKKIELEELSAKLEQTEIYQEWTRICREVTDQRDKVCAAIDEFGSYQDIENGVYGLKQAIHKVTYDVEKARMFIPDYPQIIAETVDTKVLGGLLKGGLIQQKQVDNISDISETYRYIVD